MSREYTVIKKTGEGKLLVMFDENNELSEIPANLFEDMEFVTCFRYGTREFCQVASPSYTTERGWVYEEKYVNQKGNRGGSSFWWEEKDYSKLSDPFDILCAKKIELTEKISSGEYAIKKTRSELEAIEASLRLIASYSGAKQSNE